jgi:hypothetical protein
VNPVARQRAPDQPEAPGSTRASAVIGEAHPAYDAAGVDRSLIRWMLSLTPSERLKHVQGTIDLARNVRRVPHGNR